MTTASIRRAPAKVGLVAAMVAGALMLWLGNPLIWLWIGSQMTSAQRGRMGPYFVVAIGILASTVAVSLLLARLQRAYERVTGREATVRVRLAWLRSLRDERKPDAADVTVLDLILVTTAVAAVVTFTIWFLLFAGSPLPS